MPCPPLPRLACKFGRDFEQGQPAPHVAVGGGRDQAQLVFFDLQAAPAEAAFAVGQRMLQGSEDVVHRHRLHHVHAAARQQRGVQLERGVLGGRTDEHDGAALDMRQERILLRLVEAVHLVDEQHGAAALGETVRGLGQHLSHVGQAGKHGGDRAEIGVGVLRQQQRKRGLAAARRTPQDHRMHVAAFDRQA